MEAISAYKYIIYNIVIYIIHMIKIWLNNIYLNNVLNNNYSNNRFTDILNDIYVWLGLAVLKFIYRFIHLLKQF